VYLILTEIMNTRKIINTAIKIKPQRKEDLVNIEDSRPIFTKRTKSSKLTQVWIQMKKMGKVVSIVRGDLHMMIVVAMVGNLGVVIMDINILNRILINQERITVNSKLRRSFYAKIVKHPPQVKVSLPLLLELGTEVSPL
jgi:hypothetical protein